MNPDKLPRPGQIVNFDKDYIRKTTHIASIESARTLCIGFSEAEIDLYVAPLGPAPITALTLWEDHIDSRVTKYPLVIGDVTQRTDFPDGQFDAVVTLSLLEHLTPLAGAIEEIYRVLRPEGYLFAAWGPAWSSAYGHHIYERAGDPLFDFSAWRMPAHLHLLCSPEDIMGFYEANGYGRSGGQSALHWFYEAPHINRVMFEDYAELLKPRFQFLFQQHLYTPLPATHLRCLKERFPTYSDFTTYGANWILRKCW